jgi:uncharacterized protein
MVVGLSKPTKKFFDLRHYDGAQQGVYTLLPFRFLRLDEVRYVLTNEVGEYLVCARERLQELVEHRLDKDSDFYADCKSKHILMDADSNIALDLLSLKVRSKVDKISDFTGLHIFVVTLRCDHSCPYCQVSRQTEDLQAFDMSRETADKALDLVFQSPSPSIKIEFQGGEPLLNFDLIEYVVCTAKSMNATFNKSLSFVIATNLSQLTDEILVFAERHDVYFSTSLDGPSSLHNANRPRPAKNSYEKAVEGMNKIKARLGPRKVAALMTTTKSSLSQVKSIIDEYVSHDLHEIFLRPLSPYGFAIKSKWFDSYDVEEWLKFYFEGLQYIIDINKTGYFLVEQYASIILNKIFSTVGTGYVDLQSPAGIGISVLVYNYDGNVFASDESRMLAEMNDMTFCIGNVHRDSYEQIMLAPNLLDALELSVLESVPQCRDCAFQPYCGSEPVFHHATQGDYIGHKALSGFCQRNMAIMKRFIQLLEDDPGSRDVVLSWIRP